jgi:DNA-binding GntR family transcriptional regulator
VVPIPETTEHELAPRGRSAAQRAYDYVKERLLDGRFPGGTLLSENELAQRLGVSRTPVRQAFVQLEAEQLLELYPKRGALVVPVSVGEVDAVMETRMLVERFALDKVLGTGAGREGVDTL